MGKRLTGSPKNIAKVKDIQVIRMIEEYAKRYPLPFDMMRERVDHVEGRPRKLKVETLIAAGVAHGITGECLVRGISKLLRGLDVGDQRVLGVRWVDPKHGEQLLTERQVGYLVDAVSDAFDNAVHTHMTIALDEYILEPGNTGVIVAPVDAATAEQLASTECTSECPGWWTLERLGNLLLANLNEHLGVPHSDKYAIDSYVIETFYATRSWGGKADIDPEWVTESDANLAGGRNRIKPRAKTRKQRGGGARASAASKHTVAELTDGAARQMLGVANGEIPVPTPATRDRRSRSIPPVSAVVPGDFNVRSAGFPQLHPDQGYLVHTKDIGAANAYVGAGNSRPSTIVNGRDKHTVVTSGFFPDGSPMPSFLQAYSVVAGGTDKTGAALRAMGYAVEFGVQPCEVSLDRIYTNQPTERFDQVARNAGWKVAKDLTSFQQTHYQHDIGVEYVDGYYFTSGMPEGLFDLPRWNMHATREERLACHARFDQRRPFAFRSNGTTKSGNPRFRGPAVPDRVIRDDSGNILKVTGMSVRCPNSPYFKHGSRDLPLTSCTKGQACGCSKTFTVASEDLPSSFEPRLWGSSPWAKDYYRRNLVETHNSVEEHHQGVGSRSIRVRAERWDLMHLLLTLGTAVAQAYSWFMKLGAHALDPGYFNVFDLDIVDTLIAVVGLTPPVRPPARE